MSFTITSPRVKLERKKLADLRAICDRKDIEYTEKDRKADLIDKICPSEESNRHMSSAIKVITGVKL